MENYPRVEGVERCDTGIGSASVLVIVPTYNENGNITRLLEAISKLDPKVDFDALIVDDGSKDGTRESIREYAKTAGHGVYLMSRKGKFGLGNAYLDAYRWMFEYLGEYKTVVHMDADFSHDPHMIPLLIPQASAYGVAIGSRYVVGGCTPDWNWRRVLISFGGNLYMRSVLKLFFPSYPIKDNTAGFIAWKRQVLQDVLKHDIPGDGYSFLTAEKLIAFRIGFPAIEVPIVFRDRRLGVSKISKSIIIEALSMPWKLAMKFRHITFSSSLLPPPEDQSNNDSSPSSSTNTDTSPQSGVSKSISSFLSRIVEQKDTITKAENRFWFAGFLLFPLLIYLAFIIPNIANGFESWWRIPVIAHVVPDIYLYQAWLGATAQGLPQGQFFYYYLPIFRALWAFTGGGWSMPEFLILTLALSSMASLFVLPWTLKQWAPKSTLMQRRLLTVAFLGVWSLVLGFRPGYYSWYSPVIFFGFGALAKFRASLFLYRARASIGWGLATLTAFFIYPWCLIFGGVFIVVSLMELIIQHAKRINWISFGIFVFMSFCAVVVSVFIAPVFLRSSMQAVIDLYHRTGVTSSHMPFITNALLVIVYWIILFLMGYGKEKSGFSIALGWICLLLLWLHYPFTGYFLFNEHFMQLIAPFGLISLCFIFTVQVDRKISNWFIRFFLVPILFSFLYLYKSIVPGQSIRSFIVHLINWVPLSIAVCMMIYSYKRKTVVFIGLTGLIVLGIWGYGAVVLAQVKQVSSVKTYQPLIEWIRNDGPATTRYCTDTQTATVYGAHTGRAFYPSEAMIYERVTQSTQRDRFNTVASIFDFDSAGEMDRWNYYSVYALQSPCDAFPLQSKILDLVGMSSSSIDRINGCPRAEIQSRLDIILQASRHAEPSLPLASVCDHVIVRDDLKLYWHLSESTVLLKEINGYRIYDVQR